MASCIGNSIIYIIVFMHCYNVRFCFVIVTMPNLDLVLLNGCPYCSL